MFNSNPSVVDFYDSWFVKVKSNVLRESDSFIVGVGLDELFNHYYPRNLLEPIEMDDSITETIEYKKEVRTIQAKDRVEIYGDHGSLDCEYEIIIIRIPILFNAQLQNIIKLSTTTTSLNWSPQDVIFDRDEISFRIEIKGYRFKKSADQIASDIRSRKESIYKWIERMNNDIVSEEKKIRDKLKLYLIERKKELEADSERIKLIIQKVNIPLKQIEDKATKRVQLDTKPLITRVRPVPNLPEEYVIDRQKIMDVIHILDNQGRQFEKTPRTYKNSEEEDLRNVLLVSLNAIFEGRATGETFSNRGKSDIYLNIDKGNILVCEYKFWAGPSLYSTTINQLLNYLTWRHNFGIMITFSRIKNFSKIFSDVIPAVEHHESVKGIVHKVSQTHYFSNHCLPSDENKSVEIHHIFYNLYT